MRQKGKKTVRGKITYWFIGLSIGPILLITTTMYLQRAQLIKKSALEKLSAIREFKIHNVNRWYVEQHNDLHVISSLQPIKRLEILKNNNISRSEHDEVLSLDQEILSDNAQMHNNHSNLYYVDSDNNTIMVSTDPSTVGMNLIDKDFYKKIIENHGHYHSTIYYSDLENKNTITFSSPVYCDKHAKAHLIGYLFANTDLEYEFYPLLLDRDGLGETGETLIVDENSIAQSELRWYYNAPLNLKISAKPALLAAAGSTGTVVAKDYRGKKVIASFTHLPEQKWGFVCKQDMDELNTSVNKMLLQIGILFFVFSTTAIIVSFWLGRSITEPLNEMDDVIARIRSGDYSARSKAYSREEFGSLSNMINEMAERTEERFYLRKNITELATTMVETSSIPDFGNKVLNIITSFCKARIASFHILNENNTEFEAMSSIGKDLSSFKPISVKYPREIFKNSIKQKKAALIKKIPKNCVYRLQDDKNNIFVPREIYIMPIISETSVVALIGLAASESLTERSIRLLQLSETIINTSYASLIARERSRIFSEQLYRINSQLQSKSEELISHAEELNKQKIILEDTTKKLQNKNEELEIQRRVVERANKDLESFSYSVSHDLRAPLRAIKGFSDILIEDYSAKLGDEGMRLAKIISENTNRMDALIKDLLELSRVGRKSRNISVVNMKEMANSMYHEVVDNITMKKIKLHIDNIPNIKGDPNLIRQVWANLISNAVKFSSTQKSIILKISSEDKAGQVVYSVKDNGVGFDMQFKEKLFGVFQRLHTNEEFEGTGVGLAIVKQIIDKHLGEVWAESVPGEGATFYFSLPKD